MSEHTKGAYETVSQVMAEREALRAELNAARALLREVLEADDEALVALKECDLESPAELVALTEKIRNHLDACNTLGSGHG